MTIKFKIFFHFKFFRKILININREKIHVKIPVNMINTFIEFNNFYSIILKVIENEIIFKDIN